MKLSLTLNSHKCIRHQSNDHVKDDQERHKRAQEEDYPENKHLPAISSNAELLSDYKVAQRKSVRVYKALSEASYAFIACSFSPILVQDPKKDSL